MMKCYMCEREINVGEECYVLQKVRIIEDEKEMIEYILGAPEEPLCEGCLSGTKSIINTLIGKAGEKNECRSGI